MTQSTPEFEHFLSLYNAIDKRKIPQLKSFMDRFAVNFNLYKENTFVERSFPFDMIPRIIPKAEFVQLERGLKQRVHALNLFLNDIYGEQKILKEGIIPSEFVYSSKAYLPQFHGTKTAKNIRTHISGIDLVKNSANDRWTILEDNLRVPSGASYPLSIRQAYRKIFPEFFEEMQIEKIRYYPEELAKMMNYVSTGGINVVLTPGRYNSAFYEHSFLAKSTQSVLATNQDLVVLGDKLYLKSFNGEHIQVGAMYRRLDDEFIDPLEFNPTSLIGVAGLANVYRAGNVALINSIGNGIADDKGIYYFVPQMIRYYLGEEPLIDNAPTYLPYFEADRAYVLANMEKLVIKDVAEAGGYGVLFGHKMSKAQIEELKAMIIKEPRRFIAQELIEFYDIDCSFDAATLTPRKSDLRCYVVHGEEIYVWPSGLTRYALEEGNYLVNSSQGGGFKDTWIVG
ncbi:MAG: UDP-N-acetylmuramate dehydrogenase [Sulfurovum sp. PC08-66]|nr:MAG: UDP-N-acetylmuramate dehydrogenase [Sulfurovum sp. PC08-66]KIM12692.1 MAG: UDP-N-acetylmuramate dehydrogenase [Sulfuricurvum sp. PC08-66]